MSVSFPAGSAVKNPPANAGGMGLIPGLGGSSEVGNGTPFQCSYLRNPVDRGLWRAFVQGVAKSQTQLSSLVCPWNVYHKLFQQHANFFLTVGSVFFFLDLIFYNKIEGEIQRFPTYPLLAHMYSVPHYQHHYHQHHWNGALVSKDAPTLTL